MATTKNPESKTARRIAELKERWPNGWWAGLGSREAYCAELAKWKPYGAKAVTNSDFTRATKNRNR